METTSLLLWGIVSHLIADWLLQNDWMAKNKVNLLHPAAWVHGAIHFVVMLFVFIWPLALFIAVLHIIVDERTILRNWSKFYKQTTDGPYAIHVSIWLDQVTHIVVIAGAALIQSRSL